MAQPSTTYKIDLNLTDIDRNVYENLRFTVENLLRFMAALEK